jgi:hypothetical protein
VGDALLYAARDLDCSRVNPVTAGDLVKQTCVNVWQASGNIYGHTMGRAIQALGQALGAAPLAQGSPDWARSLMGDHRRYPKTGLVDADRAALGGSPFFPGGPLETSGPTITIVTPAASADLSAPVTIHARAKDNYGVKTFVLSIDGQPVATEAFSPVTLTPVTQDFTVTGIEHIWDPAGVALGTHTISLRAEDTHGNVATASVTVTKR